MNKLKKFCSDFIDMSPDDGSLSLLLGFGVTAFGWMIYALFFAVDNGIAFRFAEIVLWVIGGVISIIISIILMFLFGFFLLTQIKRIIKYYEN